ncbi:MAG: VanZ family protein [Deltaproteobacteria bacterium]|nr:VanZ family protein [Deltaproteobacteria bacterium]
MALISLFSTDSFSNDNTGSIIEPILRAVLGRSFSEQVFDFIHYLVRKSSHVIEYAVLCGLWYRAVKPGLRGWSRKAAISACALPIIYAALDEFHQAFTSNREGRPLDVMIDSAGVLAAIAIIWFYNKRAGIRVHEHK